ncbi:MAG: flagellar basal-body rod protein FlgF [Desulfobacterales bacterium]|nr:MAG: flagellar basal-body rod protein FlgF [Desulfobacterales bacterium]
MFFIMKRQTLLQTEGKPMSSGKYAALSGAISREQAIANVSSNLANINTSGFKKSQVSFESILRGQDQIKKAKNINYDRIYTSYTNFTQGPIRQTEDPFNVAITGEGFLKVQGKDGTLYTRRGDLAVTNDGVLTTSNGLPVIGESGSLITLPDTDIKEINIAEDGSIFVIDHNNLEVSAGKIAVVDIKDKEKLSHVSDTTYKLDDPAQETIAENFTLIQGSLELSNVNPAEELSKMIDYHRTSAHLQPQ